MLLLNCRFFSHFMVDHGNFLMTLFIFFYNIILRAIVINYPVVYRIYLAKYLYKTFTFQFFPITKNIVTHSACWYNLKFLNIKKVIEMLKHIWRLIFKEIDVSKITEVGSDKSILSWINSFSTTVHSGWLQAKFFIHWETEIWPRGIEFLTVTILLSSVYV